MFNDPWPGLIYSLNVRPSVSSSTSIHLTTNGPKSIRVETGDQQNVWWLGNAIHGHRKLIIRCAIEARRRKQEHVQKNGSALWVTFVFISRGSFTSSSSSLTSPLLSSRDCLGRWCLGASQEKNNHQVSCSDSIIIRDFPQVFDPFHLNPRSPRPFEKENKKSAR